MTETNLLGHRVKDRVTGFEGVVTSRTVYLNQCVRYGVTPPVDKDGKKSEAEAFDQEDLQDLGAAFEDLGSPTGGDRPNPAPLR